MDKQPVGQLPDLTQSNNDDEIMVITNSEYNQLKKEKISDFITDLTSTDENNAIVKGTDGKLFTKDFGNASNITEGTLPVSVLPDIPKDKLPEIETDDLPDSGITAGTYTYPTDIVVNSKGQVTSITEGQAGANNANQDLSNLGPLGLDKINQSKALETGSVSSDADVYADMLKYAHSTFDLSKFTVVGSPNITDDGIASGFSTANYITTSSSFNFASAQSFEILLAITTPSNTASVTSYSGFFNTLSSDNTEFITVGYELENSHFVYRVGTTTGTFWNIYSSNTIQPDTKYYIKIKVDNTTVTIQISTNGTDWITDASGTISSPLNINNVLRFGTDRSLSRPFEGTIDLKSIAIWADGIPVFSGNKTGIDVIKPDNFEVVGTPTITDDGIASGFSGSNYPNLVYNVNSLPSSWGCTCKGITSSLPQTNSQELIYIKDTIDDNILLRVSIDGNTSKFVFSCRNSTNLYTNTFYNIQSNTQYTVSIKANGNNLTITLNDEIVVDMDNFNVSSDIQFISFGQSTNGVRYWQGSIDLNSIQVYINGNLVYQPCLKIPYTLSKTGSKIVDAAYRDRVQDVYEQYGTAMYYTLDEENKNFTLPMGEIYGMIEPKNNELNNPFSLFDSKYSETPVYNLSWLLSGTYYAKSVYVSAYEALVVENNPEIEAGTSVTLPSGGNYVKRGLSVKLSTADDITDYDFVINTTDETFRLPLKTKLASGNQVMGTGIALGLTNGTANYGLRNAKVGDTWGYLGAESKPYGTPVGENHAGGNKSNQNISLGITSEADKSGMMLSDNNLYLYFYVGETVQNANLINAGVIAETKANTDLGNVSNTLSNNFFDKITPDYNNGIAIGTFNSSTNQYTFPAYGVIKVMTTNYGSIYINNEMFCQVIGVANYNGDLNCTFLMPVKKGDTFYATNNLASNVVGSYFFPYIGGDN